MNRYQKILNNINKETPIILPLHPRTKNKISDLNIELNMGSKNFTAYTMDFTKKYIEINSDYRT